MEYNKKFQYQSNQWYNDGLKRASIHDLSGAITSLKKSLFYNSQNIASRNLLGLVYYGQGEVFEALVQWVISKNIKSHENIANYYIKKVQENPSELDTINQAIRKYNQCLTYCRQDGEDLAVIQLKRVVADHPNFVKAHQLLALLYIRTEQYSKARQQLRKAHKIDTTNDITLHYMHELNLLYRQKREKANPGKDQAVSYNLGNETIIQPVSTSLKDNAIFMTVANMLVGVGVGVAVMWFLIMPALNYDRAAQNNQEIMAYSDQIAIKDNEIRLLEKELEEYKASSAETKEALEQAEGKENAYEELVSVIEHYYTDNYDEKTLVEELLKISKKSLGVTGKKVYDNMTEAIFPERCETLYTGAQKNYDVANYKAAIEKLEEVQKMNEKYEDGQALFLLGNAYQKTNDTENAEKIYHRVIKLFDGTDIAKDAKIALREMNGSSE